MGVDRAKRSCDLRIVREHGSEPIVGAFDVVEGAAGARDAALRGVENDEEPGLFQRSARVGSAGEEVHVRGVEQVAGRAVTPRGLGEVGVSDDGVVSV